jgi:hypothetical protein
METMETLKIIQQYDAMTTITLVASLVTIFVFILLILLWNRYEKCRSERNSARFTIERLKDDLKFLHKKYDDQEKVLRDTQSRLDRQMNKMETIYVSKPPKREDETDRQYEQRCRMMVTNKAYNFVSFDDYLCSLTVMK